MKFLQVTVLLLAFCILLAWALSSRHRPTSEQSLVFWQPILILSFLLRSLWTARHITKTPTRYTFMNTILHDVDGVVGWQWVELGLCCSECHSLHENGDNISLRENKSNLFTAFHGFPLRLSTDLRRHPPDAVWNHGNWEAGIS